jgi:hypothetical protein
MTHVPSNCRKVAADSLSECSTGAATREQQIRRGRSSRFEHSYAIVYIDLQVVAGEQRFDNGQVITLQSQLKYCIASLESQKMKWHEESVQKEGYYIVRDVHIDLII